MTGAQLDPAKGTEPRQHRILARYGVALAAAGTLLVQAAPRGGAWAAYGLGCATLGIGCLFWAGRERLPRSAAVLRRSMAHTAARGHDLLGPGGAAVLPRPRPVGLGATQARAIRSEWTKFTSMRSTAFGPWVAAICIVALAGLTVATTPARPDGIVDFPYDPGVHVLGGLYLAPLTVGVVGVLAITSEYATGQIRSSFTVLPSRMSVLWAKLAVVIAAVSTTALAAIPAALLVGVAGLRSRGWSIEPSDARAWATGCWAGLYLVLVGVVGLSLGALLRSTAAAIGALAGIFFAVPIVVRLLPEVVETWMGPGLPAQAGEAVWGLPQASHIDSRPVALVVFLAWTVAAFAWASYRLVREDAG